MTQASGALRELRFAITNPEHVKRACGIFDWKENSSWCVPNAVHACIGIARRC